MTQHRHLDSQAMLEHLSRNLEFAEGWRLQVPKIALAFHVFQRRQAAGMTQAELAAAIGMKQPRIAEIERGDANPTLETITRLSIALHVEVADLLAPLPENEVVRPESAQAKTAAHA